MTLLPGDTVRVAVVSEDANTPGLTLEIGVLVRTTMEGITLRSSTNAEEVAISRESIETLEQRTAMANPGRSGAKGFLVGSVLGATFGYISGKQSEGEYIDFGSLGTAAIDAVLYGILGLALGRLVAQDRWTAVPLDWLNAPRSELAYQPVVLAWKVGF